VAPFLALNGKPRHWVETQPFLWEDPDGHERLGAKAEGDEVVRFSIDEVSPFLVFDRAPWYRNSAWILPWLCAGIGALALTVIVWPISAIVRRRFGSTLALTPGALKAYRWSRIGALAILAALTFWGLTVASMFKDLDNLTGAFDARVHFAQLFGIVAFIGGFLAMVWNLKAAFTPTRRWPARTWSVVLSLSALSVLWVAFAFKLMTLGVNY